jgi:hypothetical protein
MIPKKIIGNSEIKLTAFLNSLHERNLKKKSGFEVVADTIKRT